MSEWGVQLVIGRLLTDEQFRQRFERERETYLAGLRERGLDLTDAEVAALTAAESQVWSALASRIDGRLRSAARGAGGPAPTRRLTDREQEVLRGVFDGLTNKQIGASLGVSEGAIKATLQHLFRKTRVRTRTQLVRVAFEAAFSGSSRPR